MIKNLKYFYLCDVFMESIKESFELKGHSTYYSPDIYFIIDKMWLEIEPDFKRKL